MKENLKKIVCAAVILGTFVGALCGCSGNLADSERTSVAHDEESYPYYRESRPADEFRKDSISEF